MCVCVCVCILHFSGNNGFLTFIKTYVLIKGSTFDGAKQEQYRKSTGKPPMWAFGAATSCHFCPLLEAGCLTPGWPHWTDPPWHQGCPSPFTSTWFSNRSRDRVTQRTSMLESTSELLTCFRNTWNWSRAHLRQEMAGSWLSVDHHCEGHCSTLGQLSWQEDQGADRLGDPPSLPVKQQPQQEP